MTALPRRAALAALIGAAALTGAGQALAAKPAVAPLSAEDKALVDKAAGYLQSLNQAKGRFVQTDARGQTTAGDFYLKRPGKVRFAYDPPSGLLVVSDGYNVNVANSRLKTFDSYPLGMTPLSLFLAREIRLDKGVVVSRVARMADGFSITARDGKKEAEGQITLVFADNPMSLREWTVTDAQGQATRVQLQGLAAAADLDSSLFVLRNPKPAPVRR
ncbi:MAG: outer-membrane lipoprotein carrier protein LolA [Caulobacteraceae bacterium]|nr:outer-membrane lipoprotein carrier protein LolA [Caulobacteraceae bacterium]